MIAVINSMVMLDMVYDLVSYILEPSLSLSTAYVEEYKMFNEQYLERDIYKGICVT